MGGGPGPAGSFFGRRKGKSLRAAQADRLERLLPAIRVPPPGPPGSLDPADLFGRSVRAVRLEIGFGGGEHLAAEAKAHPDIGFVGCEAFVNGVTKLLGDIESAGLANIRIFDGDATELLPALRSGSLERIDLLFPDPWPKRRQRKRRFVSNRTLEDFARLLRPGGEFRFASDIDDYVGWTLAHAERNPDLVWTAEGSVEWERPWPGWPGTRYEAKALREGRPPAYLTFRRL